MLTQISPTKLPPRTTDRPSPEVLRKRICQPWNAEQRASRRRAAQEMQMSLLQAARQSSCNSFEHPLASKVRCRIAADSSYRNYFTEVEIEVRNGDLILSGTLDSFYFKQILQTIARDAIGGRRLLNRTVVREQSKS